MKATFFALLTGTLLSAFSGYAAAECDKESALFNDGWCLYAGAGLTYSYLHPDRNGSSWRVNDEYGHGIELTLGTRLSDHWYTEVSYVDLGSAGFVNANPAIEGTYRIDYRAPAGWVQYRLMGDETDRQWDVFLRAGLSFMINKSSDPILPFAEQTTVQFPVGAAVQWWPEPAWSLRLKLDSYDYDVYSLSGAVLYEF